jgi:hypothetical protein
MKRTEIRNPAPTQLEMTLKKSNRKNVSCKTISRALSLCTRITTLNLDGAPLPAASSIAFKLKFLIGAQNNK